MVVLGTTSMTFIFATECNCEKLRKFSVLRPNNFFIENPCTRCLHLDPYGVEHAARVDGDFFSHQENIHF